MGQAPRVDDAGVVRIGRDVVGMVGCGDCAVWIGCCKGHHQGGEMVFVVGLRGSSLFCLSFLFVSVLRLLFCL